MSQVISEVVKVHVDGSVMTLTISREAQLNALNNAVLEGIYQAINDPEVDETRVIVIQGAGKRAFAAGADIGAMAELTPSEAQLFARSGQSLMRALESLSQVVIAKVQGYALGGGLELAMACDLVVASNQAKFGLPEVNLGLIPGFGGTQKLVQRVGLPVALDMILCGKARTLSAQEALQFGLVSRVVESEALDREVEKICQAILAGGPGAQATAKRLARMAKDMSLEAGLAAESQGFGMCFAQGEAEAGIKAFLNKEPSPFGPSPADE